MKIYDHIRFANSEIVIDYSHFSHCSFQSCTVKYSGGPYVIIECSFSPDTRLEFQDAAMRTAALMDNLGILPKRDLSPPHEVGPQEIN